MAPERVDHRPPDSIWEDFVAESWQRYPALLPKVVPGALLEPNEHFDLARIAADLWRGHPREQGLGTHFQFFSGLSRPTVGLEQWLPRGEDASLQGWADRLGRSGGGSEGWCFVLQNVPRYSWEVYVRARELLRGLLDRVGLPARYVDVEQVVGTERATPWGIHKDERHTFTLVTQGTRRIWVWPYEPLAHLSPVDHRAGPHALDLTLEALAPELREQAVCFEASVGDLVYIPRTHWHVSEGNGALGAALNFGYYDIASPAMQVLPDLERMVLEDDPPRELSWKVDLDDPRTPSESVPEPLRQGLALFQGHTRDLLLKELHVRWLKNVSRSGFSYVRGPKDYRTLQPEDLIVRNPRTGFAWCLLPTGQLGWSADGHGHLNPDSEGLRELLEIAARGGGRHRVGGLLAEVKPERRDGQEVWSEARLLRNLELFFTLRVYDREHPDGRRESGAQD